MRAALAGLALLVGGCVSIWLRWPPFGIDFWLALWAAWAGVALVLLALTSALWRRHTWVARLCAGTLGALLATVMVVPVVGSVWMYAEGVSIASFETSERHDTPAGNTVHLAYVRLATTGAREDAAPIVYLSGGPGGSGILTWLLQGRQRLFDRMRRFGDVIALDQRGTMPWNAPWLVCPETWSYPPDAVLSRARAAGVQRAAVRACAEWLVQAGVDLPAYNTWESAADLDALRRRLGASRLTLWGSSYGTHLALAYLRRYPGRVERLVLHGVEGPDHTHKLPTDATAALANLAGYCEAADLPDPRTQLARLRARLAERPVVVAEGSGGGALVLGAEDVRLFVALQLRSAATRARLPGQLAQMLDGNFDALARLAHGWRHERRDSMMSLVMDCSSGASPARLAQISDEARTAPLGDLINMPFAEVCEAVPHRDLGAAFRSPVVSSVPALLISGTLDGRTPVANASEVLTGLSRGVHLVVDGAGHGGELFSSSPEIAERIAAFMNGQEVDKRPIQVPFVPLAAAPPPAELDRPDA